MGHLLRRRRGLQLARRRRAVGGGRDGRDVDRSLLRAHAAGAREVRPRRRARRLDPAHETRSVARRRPGSGLRRECRRSARVGRRALELTKLASVTTPVFMAQGRRDFLFGIEQAARAFRQLVRARSCSTSACTATPRRRSPRTTPEAHGDDTRLVRLLPAHALRPVAHRRRDRSGDVGRARQPADRPPPDATDDRRVPGRHDLRSERKGRPDVRANPKRHRDLRRADGQGVDRSARRLVEARRRPHRSHAKGSGDRRQRRRRPDEARRAERDDPSGEPGDVPPEGIAAHAHARLVFDRAGEREPPLPRSPDGAERSGTRRHGRPQAAGPAHAGHE